MFALLSFDILSFLSKNHILKIMKLCKEATLNKIEATMKFTITINADINECDGANDCNSKLGVCNNNAGGYSCSCKTGYSGDGRTCVGRYHCFYSYIRNVIHRVDRILHFNMPHTVKHKK